MNTDFLFEQLKKYGNDIDGALERFVGDTDLYCSCLISFLNEPNLQVLTESLARHDIEQAFRAAHSLKGLAGNLGLTPLFENICILVESLRAKNIDNIDIEYEIAWQQFKILEHIVFESQKSEQKVEQKESSTLKINIQEEKSFDYSVAQQPQEEKPKEIAVEPQQNVFAETAQKKAEENKTNDAEITATDDKVAIANFVDEADIKRIRKRPLKKIVFKGVSVLSLIRQNIFTFFILLFVGAIVFSAYKYYNSYVNLEKSVKNERIEYVGEISKKIISSYQYMEGKYISIVNDYASIVESQDFQTFEEFSSYFENIGNEETQVLLIARNGQLFDLDKKYVPSNIADLRLERESPQMFTSLAEKDNYWLFAAPIDMTFGEDIYKNIVFAVSQQEYNKNLSLSFFNDEGLSLIIDNEGVIEVKATHSKSIFDSYNFFTTLQKNGVSQKDVLALQESIQSNETGNVLTKINGDEWLIYFGTIDEDDAIVVAVPIYITGAETLKGSQESVLYATLTTLLLFLLVVYALLYFYFLTRRKRKVAMQLSTTNNFFSKLNHDMKTPLNAIMGLTTLARATENIDEKNKMLQEISVSSKYLLSIINDIVDMSNITSGQMNLEKNIFNIDNIVEELKTIIAESAKEKNINFALEYLNEGDNNEYVGDKKRLFQILFHILTNAIKFTHERGFVKLKVSRSPLSADYDQYSFIISDTGIGIHQKYLPRLFEPFDQAESSFTSQSTGSGLGLPIVKSLVQLMEGRIDVSSRLNVGTTFKITLPLKRASKSNDFEHLNEKSTFVGKRILLAEDNVLNQKITVALLSMKFGIKTDIAENGKIALKMFESASENYYDLILMDIKMPVMDGLESAQKIRTSNKNEAKTIPIVALSANSLALDIQASLNAGMNDHLAKPIDIADLAKVLQKYLLNSGEKS